MGSRSESSFMERACHVAWSMSINARHPVGQFKRFVNSACDDIASSRGTSSGSDREEFGEVGTGGGKAREQVGDSQSHRNRRSTRAQRRRRHRAGDHRCRTGAPRCRPVHRVM